MAGNIKQEDSHLTKSIRKNFNEKKKNRNEFLDENRNHAEPYKKPKTNFRHYLEDHLDDDDELLNNFGLDINDYH